MICGAAEPSCLVACGDEKAKRRMSVSLLCEDERLRQTFESKSFAGNARDNARCSRHAPTLLGDPEWPGIKCSSSRESGGFSGPTPLALCLFANSPTDFG